MRSLIAIATIAVLNTPPARAVSSFADEKPYADHHVATLPKVIQRSARQRAAQCGNELSALHNFTVSIDGGGRRFVSVHYDRMRCDARQTVCGTKGCLHEIWTSDRDGWARTFHTFADETILTNAGSRICLEIRQGSRVATFAWTRDRFVPSADCWRQW